MALTLILSTLSLIGTTIASCQGTFTINAITDASDIAGCSTFDGDVIISSQASGQITIDGVGAITGDLRCSNASQLTSISADTLQTIGGRFDLQELQIMSTLSFKYLTGVNTINWITLPALQALNFGGSGVTRANNVLISNTGLTDITGIALTAVSTMNLNNNQYLKTINVNNLANVTSGISIRMNGLNLEVDFPNLQSAANLTFSNVTSISMPSLAEVQGSIGLYGNYMSSFSLPNLTSTGNTIAVVDSSQLSNLSFPKLTTVGGGLTLANNSKLQAIDGFDALVTVDGDINFHGSFNAVSFASIQEVKGAANIYTSSGNSKICDLFSNAKKSQVIKGQLTCDDSSQLPSTNNGSSTNSGTSSSGTSGSSGSSGSANTSPTSDKSGISGGEIAGIVVGSIAAIAIIGIIIFCLRRRKGKKSPAATMENEPRPGHHQLPLGGHHEKAELQSSPNQVSELTGMSYAGHQYQQPTSTYKDHIHGKAEMHGEPHIVELSGTVPYSHNSTGQHGASVEMNTSGNGSAPGYATGSESTAVNSHYGSGQPMSEAGDHWITGVTGAPATEPSYSRAQSTRIPNSNLNQTGAPHTSTSARPVTDYDAVM